MAGAIVAGLVVMCVALAAIALYSIRKR